MWWSATSFSIDLYLESLRQGATWLGIGIVVTLLATLALCLWLLYQNNRPVAVAVTPHVTLLGNTGEGLRIEDPQVQAAIRRLQAAYNRGEIDGADFRAGLAKIRQGQVA